MTPKLATALIQSGAGIPGAAVTARPSAGPIARLMLNPMLLMATACCRSWRGTSCGTIDCQAGAASAPPAPIRKVKISKLIGVTRSRTTSAAKTALTAVVATSTPIRKRRRSMMSASAPAGSANTNTGRLAATWTSDTMSGSGLRPVISQPEAAVYIQVPIFAATVAAHSTVKVGWRNGLHGETGRAGGLGGSGSVRGPSPLAMRVCRASAPCEAAASAAATTGHRASRQIEQENFRVVQCRNRERGFVFCRRAVARPQGLAVERDRAADHLHPALAAGRERVGDLVAAAEERCVDPRVLMDNDRSVSPVGRPDQAKPPALLGIREGLLVVARPDPLPVGQHPDLQEMHRLLFRVIELAVPNAGARRHHLHVARADHRPGADAVLMLQRALQHIGDDLHVAMPMGVESAAGLDPVLVDDPQGTEAHVLGIVILAEREGVAAVQPSEVGDAPFLAVSDGNHGDLLGVDFCSGPQYHDAMDQ